MCCIGRGGDNIEKCIWNNVKFKNAFEIMWICVLLCFQLHRKKAKCEIKKKERNIPKCY